MDLHIWISETAPEPPGRFCYSKERFVMHKKIRMKWGCYMSKRDRTTTQRKIDKYVKEGRGQGEGASYQPWLNIQDVPSNGRVSRVKGWKTGRIHHLMSQLELQYFYVLEWASNVIDIREQYPLLPIERTQQIAEELGIKHPEDPSSKEPVVMTTDFAVTVMTQTGAKMWARTIKPQNKLGMRALEKFRIEHRYYLDQGINWGIVTDQDIPKTLAANIEFIHDYYDLPSIPLLDATNVHGIASKLFKELSGSTEPLSKVALRQDHVLGLEPGTCLAVVKHKLARKQWKTEMKTQRLVSAQFISLEESESNVGSLEGGKIS